MDHKGKSVNFIELSNLPVYDLYTEFLRLLDEKKIWWHHDVNDQICLNATKAEDRKSVV